MAVTINKCESSAKHNTNSVRQILFQEMHLLNFPSQGLDSKSFKNKLKKKKRDYQTKYWCITLPKNVFSFDNNATETKNSNSG